MSKIKIYTIIAFAPVFFLYSLGLNADALYEIQTGKSNSASWQFTTELSEYWQRKQVLHEKPQNKHSYFVPRHVKGFYQRFKNLDKQQCKLIIAPLKFFTELPIDEIQVKVATVLWEVYLAPVTMKGISEIGMYDEQKWIIPEDSLIIPSYIQTLRSKLRDSSADMKPELVEFAQTVNWPPVGGQVEKKDQESVDLTNESDLVNNEISFGRHSTKLQLVERKSISSLMEESFDGVLFYEMLGSPNKLLSTIGEFYRISSLDSAFIANLLKYNRFLERNTIRKLNVKTVGVTYVLYVHKDEDPEFVKEILGVLAKQPRTYFGRFYLMKNLSLKTTREISPLFLHQGTIEFFHMD